MTEYGVGRNAAREAVQALVAMGLVDVRPGRGATVIAVEGGGMDTGTIAALLKDHAIDDLYEFRRLLEVETAIRAAERATEDDVDEMKAAHARFVRARRNRRPTSRLDDEFHAAIAEASHNALFVTMLDAVGDLIRSARTLAERVPWAADRALVEHEQLLEAISRHDPQAAANVMREHMDGAIEAIREGRKLESSEAATGDGSVEVV